MFAALHAAPGLFASDKTAPAIEPLAIAHGDLHLLEFADATAGETAAATTNLNVRVESGGLGAITVGPGGLVEYQVIGILGDDNNQGLALVGFDLDFDGGDLSQADNPTGDPDSGCENPMIHFTMPWGVTNPAGFGGTIIQGDLIQVGGAQNTINNTPDNAPAPIGNVLLGVAQPSGCGTAVLVIGTLTAPSEPGSYTLALEYLFSNIIRADATPGPFWATQAAGVGTVANLAILVENAPQPEGACCLATEIGCATTTAAACGASGGNYHGDGSNCEDDLDADGVADVCDACPESNMGAGIIINGCNSDVENQLTAGGCTMLDEIGQCAAGASRISRFGGCVITLVDQWRIDALITTLEGDRIVGCIRPRAMIDKTGTARAQRP